MVSTCIIDLVDLLISNWFGQFFIPVIGVLWYSNMPKHGSSHFFSTRTWLFSHSFTKINIKSLGCHVWQTLTKSVKKSFWMGMLAQGPAPDPKCKLNISSFLILPHLLDCLISPRNSMSILLLLWIWGGGGWLIHIRVWVGKQGVGIISKLFLIFLCTFVFWSLISCLLSKWVEHDSCCICFFVYYLFSLPPVPSTRSYWGIEIVVSVM